MSRFARIVAPVAMLAVMSLGSAAHAQDSDGSSQQAGATAPGQTPGSTTTTTAPVPRAIPVTVSWGTGRVGSTIKVSADVRGCTQLGSARGEFRDRMGAVRPLGDQLVTGSSRFTALFVVNSHDAIGWGRVRVVCDVGLPTARQGYASFQVYAVPAPTVATVTPTAGGPGTVVTVRAEIHGSCDTGFTFFQDSKGRTVIAREPFSSRDPRVVARYTITKKDAVGRGRFGVSCDMRLDTYRVGYASFWVRAPRGTGGSSGGSVSGGSSSGRVTANRGNGTVQVPTAIDTGLGGTADGTHRAGIDPAQLLRAAGWLLIAVAIGLRIRQAITRRRQ